MVGGRVDVEILNFWKREKGKTKREREKDRERSALCRTGSKSRQRRVVVFVGVIFAEAASRLPPIFSRARACNVLAFFLAGNLLEAVRRWRSCVDARACSRALNNKRRVCLLVGCSLFQRKRQNKKI